MKTFSKMLDKNTYILLSWYSQPVIKKKKKTEHQDICTFRTTLLVLLKIFKQFFVCLLQNNV